MLKWIAVGICCATLGICGWLYFAAGIPDFTRRIAVAAASEPECQLVDVIAAMRGHGDAEMASRRHKMVLLVAMRLAPRSEIEQGGGRIWKLAARELWARSLVPDDERARAACALGNAGGPPKNLPWLARIVAARPLHDLDASEREAIMLLYFNNLGGPLTLPQIREGFRLRLVQVRLHPVGHAP